MASCAGTVETASLQVPGNSMVTIARMNGFGNKKNGPSPTAIEGRYVTTPETLNP